MAFTVYGPKTRDPINLTGSASVRPVSHSDGAHNPMDRETSNQGFTRVLGLAAKNAYAATTAPPKERAPAFQAHQIMTSPVLTLPIDSTLLDAWKLIRERRFRHMPVLDLDGRLAGILSDRALLRYAAVTGHIPPYAVDSLQARTPITEIIKREVITATPDTEIRDVARAMFEKRIGAMPIMDQRDRLVGIITGSDILRTLINHAPLELWV